MIIHYIVDKNIFGVFAYKLLAQKKKLKRYLKDYFKIKGKLRIQIPKKGEQVKFKNFERKIKTSFMIYPDFEGILVSENNAKQNPDEFFINKYQKHVACSYGYQLVSFNNKFCKLFNLYLGEDAIYNFVNSMTEGSKYCTDMMKKRFKKKNVMSKDDDEDFKLLGLSQCSY